MLRVSRFISIICEKEAREAPGVVVIWRMGRALIAADPSNCIISINEH